MAYRLYNKKDITIRDAISDIIKKHLNISDESSKIIKAFILLYSSEEGKKPIVSMFLECLCISFDVDFKILRDETLKEISRLEAEL